MTKAFPYPAAVNIDYWIYHNEPEGKGQACLLVAQDDKKAKKVRS